MSLEIDFSHLGRFPGETGNLFDVVLHKFERVEKVPAYLFAIILGMIALPLVAFNWTLTVVLWFFFALDWLMLLALPIFHRSYGPSKPTVLLLAVLRAFFGWMPIPWFIILQVIGAIIIFYSCWIEPHSIWVTRKVLRTSKIRQGLSLRILHLGDLHIEKITRREIDLNKKINELKPDLILFSGDILNLSYREDPLSIIEAQKVMREWAAPLGVYVVSGSPAVDLERVFPEIVNSLPVRRLNDEKITLPPPYEQVDIIGITCSHRPHIDGPKLNAIIAAQAENFSVLIYHTPDLAPISARCGIDLQLSGHTHGGQVRIPGFGALVTGSLYGKRFEAGRYFVDKMTLYVTRGIGMEGAAAPRMRLFCPPEIILWEIHGTQS